MPCNIVVKKLSSTKFSDQYPDSLAPNPFISYILPKTCLTSLSETLIDYFSNIISLQTISGNLTSTIFLHLPRCPFLIKKNLYLASFLLIEMEHLKFTNELLFTQLKFFWTRLTYCQAFLHRPKKKSSNLDKLWIMAGFQISVSVKNKFQTDFIIGTSYQPFWNKQNYFSQQNY